MFENEKIGGNMMNDNETRNEEIVEETEFKSVDTDEVTENEILDEFVEELPQRELSSTSRFINTFIEPSKTMKDIIAKPTILFPIIVIFMVSTFSAIITIDLTREIMIQSFIDSGQMPSESIINMSVYSVIGFAGLGTILVTLVSGIIIHGLSLLVQGRATLKTTLSVMFHSTYISLAGMFILSFVQYATNNIFISFSPAMLLTEDKFGSASHMLLASLDVFNIWYIIVAIIGISVTHKISKIKACVSVLIPTIVFVAIAAYFTF